MSTVITLSTVEVHNCNDYEIDCIEIDCIYEGKGEARCNKYSIMQ